MSANLTELVRRNGGTQGTTALELLKRAAAEHGGPPSAAQVAEIAGRSGLPEAAVHGVSTYYEDLQEQRGRRHLRVCRGSACFAAGGERALERLSAECGLKLGERGADGELSLGEVACLGLCHSAPAILEGSIADAGAGAYERALAGTCVNADEPQWRSALGTPVLLRPGDFSALAHVLEHATPAQLRSEVLAAELRGRGGAGFPAGRKWQAAAAGPSQPRYIVANGDEGDPGSYIDKQLMERNPQLLLEGMALAAYAIGAGEGFILVRSEYPRSRAALEQAIAQALSSGWLGDQIAGSDFSFHVSVHEGAGSYVSGEESSLLACLEGLRGSVSARPPFPAESGLHGLPTLVHNIETLANVPHIARHGAAAYRQISPGGSAGSKLVCFNERFARPGVWEVPFGISLRELCEGLAGGVPAGLKALQIGGPLGGILPAELIDTAFDFGPLQARGCMLGHGSILAFDQQSDMGEVARHLLRFGARESCGKCFPCRIGLQRALERFQSGGPIERAPLEELLDALEAGSLCAHGSGMAAPIRSLIEHFPGELGLA